MNKIEFPKPKLKVLKTEKEIIIKYFIYCSENSAGQPYLDYDEAKEILNDMLEELHLNSLKEHLNRTP